MPLAMITPITAWDYADVIAVIMHFISVILYSDRSASMTCSFSALMAGNNPLKIPTPKIETIETNNAIKLIVHSNSNLFTIHLS